MLGPHAPVMHRTIGRTSRLARRRKSANATADKSGQPGQPRQRMGRYELGSQIGVGATATVWRATDTRNGSPVCMKVLHPHLATDPVARARLEAEAAASAEISHPALLPLLDSHFADSEAALVFPLLDGETLAARLARVGRLEPAAAAAIAIDIAGALDAVHSRGLVHRDVKPANILLAGDGTARLLDFGISHSLSLPADELTGAGMTVGTLPYMSPEQLAGLQPEPANDVYALGAVLYEMLAGHRPYDAATPDELAQAHLQPPADVPTAPRPLLALAWAALARDTAARPSAQRLRDGLRAWVTEGSLPAPPMAAAGALTAVTPAAGRRPPTAEMPRASDRMAAARAPRSGARRAPAWLAGVALVGLVAASALALGPRLITSAGAADTTPLASPAAPAEAVTPADVREDALSVIVSSLNRLVESLAGGKPGQEQPPADGNGAGADQASDDEQNGDRGKDKKDRDRGRGNGDDD